MIDIIADPHQILIIDDNQTWLDRLAALNFQVLNSFNKNKFELSRSVREKEKDLSDVLVNANVLFREGDCRTLFLGIELVNDILMPRFPDLSFYLLSFVPKVIETNQIVGYIEFLKYINQKYYDGK